MNENNNGVLNNSENENNTALPMPETETETKETAAPQTEVTKNGDEEVGETNTAESVEQKTEPEEQKAELAFRWEYTEQKTQKTKTEKAKGRGGVTYAVIMGTVFLLAFAVLFASMALDDIGTMFLKPELSVVEIVEKGMPSSILVLAIKGENGGSSGGGFVVNSYGYVATNYHVVEDAVSIIVIDSTGTQYTAQIVDYDAGVDLALLYAEDMDIKAATLADSSKAKLGETVVAIGCPTGSGSHLSVSDGIISGFDRTTSVSTESMIQTNAPLNPGNSGGPLFDSRGNVVGIVTAKLFYGTGNDEEKIPLEGIAYAIPINSVKETLDKWIAQDLTSPMLGISAVSVEAGNTYFYDGSEGIIYGYENTLGKIYKINSMGVKTELTEADIDDPENIIIDAKATGIYVLNVTRGLGAYGKLERGDIVTELDGVKIASVVDARDVFDGLSAGDTVSVKYFRGEEYAVVKMTLKTKGDMMAAERNQ